MIKNKYPVIFICIMLLLCSSEGGVAAEKYTDNVEVGEVDIKMDRSEHPPIACLIAEFKNNGGKKISNLSFEIKYYAKDGYLIKKIVIKNALNEDIPQGETRKYKIRLKRDFFDEKNMQYPYSRSDEVTEFDLKITNVKFASK